MIFVGLKDMEMRLNGRLDRRIQAFGLFIGPLFIGISWLSDIKGDDNEH